MRLAVRGAHAIVAAAAGLAGAALACPATASVGALSVRLVRAGPMTVRQGEPFSFDLVAASKDSESESVALAIAPAASRRAPTAFARPLVVVPPGGSTRMTERVTPSQWYAATGRYRLTASLHGASLGPPLTFRVTAPRLQAPAFKDVTRALGLATTLPPDPCGEWSSGAAWADVNGDGRLDLFINHGAAGFTNEAAARGVDDGGRVALGASFADYDNDGDPDLFVANDGIDRLYRNDGTGHFVDVAPQAGVADTWDSMSGSWVDYDGDGHLDLYVANHARCPGSDKGLDTLTALEYEPDHLYQGNGDGTFTDVTALLGANATIGAGFLGAWFDYNGDGRQDLYLANDYLGSKPDRNHLWRNDGPGANGWQFTDVSTASGTSFAMNTMGVAIGDYNRDGRLDLALTNFASSRLLRNNGDGTFKDVAPSAGVARPWQQADQRSVTWGAIFADLNLDGWEDLYVGAGYLWTLNVWYGERFAAQPNELFVNGHDGTFLDLSAPSHAADAGQTRGVAVADFNRDGRLDLYVVNQNGSPHLYENVTPYRGHHWLEVRTRGTVSNRDACGARLVATTSAGSMTREVLCGSTSVSSGSDTVVHFGLGTATQFTLRITWPSGTSQTLTNLRRDRLVTLAEPRV
jgi:hypothetical protein